MRHLNEAHHRVQLLSKISVQANKPVVFSWKGHPYWLPLPTQHTAQAVPPCYNRQHYLSGHARMLQMLCLAGVCAHKYYRHNTGSYRSVALQVSGPHACTLLPVAVRSVRSSLADARSTCRGCACSQLEPSGCV